MCACVNIHDIIVVLHIFENVVKDVYNIGAR